MTIKAFCVARFVLEIIFLETLQHLNINYTLTFHSAIELMNINLKTCQFCIVQKFKIWNPQILGTALMYCI